MFIEKLEPIDLGEPIYGRTIVGCAPKGAPISQLCLSFYRHFTATVFPTDCFRRLWHNLQPVPFLALAKAPLMVLKNQRDFTNPGVNAWASETPIRSCSAIPHEL